MGRQTKVSRWGDKFKRDSREEAKDFSAYGQIQKLLESSSNEDSLDKKRAGSLPVKRTIVNHEHDIAVKRLSRQYFAEASMYDDEMFRRRYFVLRTVF